MIFADTTPGSVRISSSARLMGRTLPAMLFKFNLLCGNLMLRETGGQYCRRPTVNQAKSRNTRTPERNHFTAEQRYGFPAETRCLFHITAMRVSYHYDTRFISPRSFISARLLIPRRLGRY